MFLFTFVLVLAIFPVNVFAHSNSATYAGYWHNISYNSSSSYLHYQITKSGTTPSGVAAYEYSHVLTPNNYGYASVPGYAVPNSVYWSAGYTKHWVYTIYNARLKYSGYPNYGWVVTLYL